MLPMKNKYAGLCIRCGIVVDELEGYLYSATPEGRLHPYHQECMHVGPSGKWIPRPKDGVPTVEATTTPVAERMAAEDEAKPITEAEISMAADDVVDRIGKAFLTLVPEMVRNEVLNVAPRVLELKVGKAATVKLTVYHKSLPDILTAVHAGVHPFLVGPAGSGKTTLAEQVATTMKRKFYMAARVTSEYKLLGFVDATGRTVRTQFREAFEHGGVFLFDEVDASDPDALTAFNAALANGIGDFPDGMVRMHKDFAAIAAGNTFGRGADRQYVGRNQLDAATLDRFTTFEVDYDEDLELQLAGDAEWTKWVQRVRSAIVAEKVRHVVSPRASIYGARLLAAGMERGKVAEACVWKGLDETQRARVSKRMNGGAL